MIPPVHDDRAYQQSARHQINAELNAVRSPILANPTGTGKTVIGVQVIADRVRLGRRVYILVPSVEVFAQWVAALVHADLNPGWINDEGVRGRGRMVYVCMPLSLRNVLTRIPESIHPDELIIDEAHHDGADTWVAICDFFRRGGGTLPKLGITATPTRTDNRTLPGYDSIIQTITMHEAIEQGYLAKPLVILPDELYRRIDIPSESLDTDEGLEKQAALLGDPVIVGNMLDIYLRVFNGLPVLVACPTYSDANDTTDAFRAAGWKWEHIHGELSKSERTRMVRGIRNGTINGLCTVGVGIEGWDIPGLYGLFWRRRTNSIRINRQFNGRVLRPLDGKQYGVIVDMVGNTFIHGMPDREIVWNIVTGAEPEHIDNDTPTMRICPRCGVANATANTHCHMCGLDFSSDEAHEIRTRRLPAIIDGNLVAITSDGLEEMIEARHPPELFEEDGPGDVPEHAQRIDLLVGGLFAPGRGSMMKDALEGFRR